MGQSVRVRDRGANDLLRRMDDASRPHTVRVGVIGSKAAGVYQDGSLTTADVATFHEFGLGVPQRSWLRGYIDENEGALKLRLRGIGKEILKKKKTVEQGLNLFGLETVGDIQERMAAGIPGAGGEPARRLINTGQFRSSITYDIEAA